MARMTLSFRDLRITKVNEDGSFSPHMIKESEYYKALEAYSHEESKQIFNAYKERLAKHHYKRPFEEIPERTFDQFIELFTGIIDHFDLSKGDILINDRNEITDGQHRVSILCYLFGYGASFEVENGKVTAFVGASTWD
jgi:hypothetical protein